MSKRHCTHNLDATTSVFRPVSAPLAAHRRPASAAPNALLRLIATLFVAGCGTGDQSASDVPVRDTAAASRPAVQSVLPERLDGIHVRSGARAIRLDVRRDTSTYGTGVAVATLADGDTVVIGERAIRGWVLGDGTLVAISGTDGAGGYENEGQSLTVVDLTSGARRRVVADYFAIVRVEAVEQDGKVALLVHMRDGGQGGLHVTVVDPDRGQVFRALHALGRISGARVLVSGYGDGEVPVEFGDRRTPLRVDSISVAAADTLPLLVIPRSGAQ